MGVSTSVLVRVQARGGKFLGPDIGYSYITIRDVASGNLLAQSVAAGDSGQLGPTLGAGVSSGAVIIDSTTVNWLSVTDGSPSPTAGFLATFELDRPALIEISAAGQPTGVPTQHTTSVQMWIWPGAQLTTEPGLILELPGLNVEILEPNPAQPPPPGASISVRAWVTMMCGCKIEDGKPWPTGEFEVNAWLVAPDGTIASTALLAIEVVNHQQVPSVFTGALPYPEISGDYQLVVSAIQPALSNTGGSGLLVSL
jgi:hypothetical protein